MDPRSPVPLHVKTNSLSSGSRLGSRHDDATTAQTQHYSTSAGPFPGCMLDPLLCLLPTPDCTSAHARVSATFNAARQAYCWPASNPDRLGTHRNCIVA